MTSSQGLLADRLPEVRDGLGEYPDEVLSGEFRVAPRGPIVDLRATAAAIPTSVPGDESCRFEVAEVEPDGRDVQVEFGPKFGRRKR